MTTRHMPKLTKPSKIRLRRRILLMLTGLIAIAVVGSGGWFPWQKPRSSFDEVKRALKERRLSQAEMLARSWLTSHPNDIDAMIILGESLQRQGNITEAIDVYQRVPSGSGQKGTTAISALASIFWHQGRLEEAETKLLQVHATSEQAPIVDGLWVTLLSLSGRRWESIPYLYRTLNLANDPLMKLIYLANLDEMPAPPDDVLARMFKIRDPLGALGCGRMAAALGRSEQATGLVRECLLKRPELIEAHVLQGLLYLDAGELDKFDQWVRELPKAADAHPSIWFLQGRRAQDAGQRSVAIRCYWEVLRRQPNNDRSTYQLGQLLTAEGRSEDAGLFLSRAKKLTRLIELAVRMFEDRGTESENEECARLAYDLGRLQECKAWCELTLSMSPDNSTAFELVRKLGNELRADTPWLLPDSDLAARIDLSSFPLPDRNISGDETQTLANTPPIESRPIAYVDDAERMGLKFVYFNGDDASSEGKRMFEYTGGGVSAFDYDLDGWCDVYFTQGTTWPPNQSNHEYLDVLFRNIAGQFMQDVTATIGIKDSGFGQGVAASDYDNDGFHDLYVANVDGNKLYHNNGDGTFSDVTKPSGLGTHPHWTTSCLVADLNGDSLPDVYDVTFLEGDDVFSRICRGDDGKPRSCAPAGFTAAPDHVYMNQGDGTFRETTREWGFDVPNGDGLGIVAGDFDESGTISLFVGNDGRPNFFFVPETMTNGQVHWSEIGVISGLAYDDSGAAQASMGIAAGDANNDGRLDLFVTNFYNESDTLYINLGSRMFTERARATGLCDPSWSMLGFGSQFLDADRDGWEDLILVNGHVDDFTHKQIPYKMRPQFYQNQRTRFVERFGKDVGPFFDEPRLGRGLARLDWNRDGLNEVAISHIGDSAALLTNRTPKAGHGIGLRLVGTNRSRDAIGTRVTVRVNGIQLTRQLTAGDGYQATNEHRLDFGLADESNEVEFEIHWMGGKVQSYKVVPTDREYIAVEGRGEMLRLLPDRSPQREPSGS